MILLFSLSVASAAEFSARLQSALRDYAAEQLQLPPADIEVRSTGFAGAGCGDRLLVTARGDEDFLGRTDLRITALDGEQACGQWRIQPDFSVWQMLPTAASAAGPGAEIAVVPRRVRLDRPVGTPVDLERGPFIALSQVRAGDVVVQQRVRLAPDVKAGQSVKLEVISGSLTIRGEGRLLSAARLGEAVTVRSDATGVLLKGTLVAVDRVRVE